MDHKSAAILSELQKDARVSFAELGRRVGLSTPATAERVRKMEDSGLIRGYTADVDPARAGLPVAAFIRIRVSGGESLAKSLLRTVRQMPEVFECHRCTGEESFILKVRVESVSQMERLIDRLAPYGMTSTSLILSSPIERRVIEIGGFPA